jgi:type II secretory pathway pseudopilin PulG
MARRVRHAFTLIEAMISTSITVIAGSAVLLGISSSMKSTTDTLNQTVAAGMAQQLMDEIAGQLYCQDPTNPYQYPLTPNAYELAGVCRERFNDIDDYNGFTTQPPKDRWGAALGNDDGQGGTRNPLFRLAATNFVSWRQSVLIYYVDPINLAQALPAGQTSACRAVEVRISLDDPLRGQRLLASLRRVFSYVPNQ